MPKLFFRIVFGGAYGPLPEVYSGYLYEGYYLPRKGELMHLEGSFWEVEHIIHWGGEDNCPTVILVSYPQSDVMKG